MQQLNAAIFTCRSVPTSPNVFLWPVWARFTHSTRHGLRHMRRTWTISTSQVRILSLILWHTERNPREFIIWLKVLDFWQRCSHLLCQEAERTMSQRWFREGHCSASWLPYSTDFYFSWFCIYTCQLCFMTNPKWQIWKIQQENLLLEYVHLFSFLWIMLKSV